jgi:hypothetical protein
MRVICSGGRTKCQDRVRLRNPSFRVTCVTSKNLDCKFVTNSRLNSWAAALTDSGGSNIQNLSAAVLPVSVTVLPGRSSGQGPTGPCLARLVTSRPPAGLSARKTWVRITDPRARSPSHRAKAHTFAGTWGPLNHEVLRPYSPNGSPTCQQCLSPRLSC